MVWNGVTGNGLDPTYRAALTAPHTIYSRVDVTDYLGNVLLSDLPITAGSVTATLQSRIARTIQLTTYRDYFPVTALGALDPAGTLSPFGHRLRAYRGITYGDGSSSYFPVFYGVIDGVRLLQDGTVTVAGNDLAAEVVDGGFETPAGSVTSLNVGDQFRALVSVAVAGAQFGTSDVYAINTPALVWQSDRARACDDLAAGVGAIWYPLADGRFVIRRVPWTVAGQVAALTFSDGPGGGLASWSVKITRQGVNNSIVYASERLTGEPPVFAIARDDNPASATYVKGPFGLKPRLVQNQASLKQPQAFAAAQVLLGSARALTMVWENVSIVPDASLELGDLITCTADGVRGTQVVSGFTLDLMGGGAMPVTLRAYTPI